MTPDEIRESFEARYPLPAGVHWDGDHYVADKNVPVSFRNAIEWSAMFRGWKACWEHRQESIDDLEMELMVIGEFSE